MLQTETGVMFSAYVPFWEVIYNANISGGFID
jgi:hypothetical protein